MPQSNKNQDPGVFLQDVLKSGQRIIIKHRSSKAYKYSPIYLMGNDPGHCIHSGLLLAEAVDAMMLNGVLSEIPHKEVQLLYSKHSGFLADNIPGHRYYEILRLK